MSENQNNEPAKDQSEDQSSEEQYPGATSEGLAETAEIQMPTIGRTVYYVLSVEDAQKINRRRVAKPDSQYWPAGAQAHVGNHVGGGEIVPLVVAWDSACALSSWAASLANCISNSSSSRIKIAPTCLQIPR